MVLFFKVIFILILPQVVWGQGTQLSCESKRLLKVSKPSDHLFEPSSLVISSDGRTLTYNMGSESFSYNINTGQSFWNIGNSRKRLQVDEKGLYFESRPAQNIGGRKRSAQKERAPAPVKKMYEALRSINSNQLRKKVEKCRKQKNFKEQLRSPLLPIETRSCKENLEELQKIQLCEKNNNCAEVFENLEKSREGPQTSFVQLFENGIKMTDPQQRIGKVMVADSAVSYAAGTLFVANRKAIARVALRVGIKFNMVASLLFLASTMSKPLLLAFLDYDNCGDKGFEEGQGRSLDDCLGQSANKIQSVFHDELLTAFENPNKFIKDISQKSDGRIGRLTCYAFESMLNDWKEKYHEYKNIQCQGRLLTLGNKKTYLIHSDGHVYRHQGMDRTYHFYPQGKVIVEDRNTEKKHEAIFTSDINNYINRGSPSRAEVAQRKNEVKNWTVPQYVWNEQFMMGLIYPKIKKNIKDGLCRVETSTEVNSTSQ